MDTQRKILIIVLRVSGVMAMLAIFPVFFPFPWMQAIHEWMGMGQMPHAPIVGYLARSLSLFYTFLGAVFVYVSFDLERYKLFLRVAGLFEIFLGCVMFYIDFHEKMPLNWTLFEGMINLFLGIFIFVISHRLIKSVK